MNTPIERRERRAAPLVRIEQLPALRRFAPDRLIVAAGFEARADDPPGVPAFGDDGLHGITSEPMQAAEASATGRLQQGRTPRRGRASRHQRRRSRHRLCP